MLAELGENCGPFGARADDVHLAFDHVEQLRKLIQSILTQEPAHRRDAGVLLLCPYCAAAVLRIDPHRAELVDSEWLSTKIVLPSVVLGAACGCAPVQAHTLLGVEYWSTGGQPHEHSDEEHDWHGDNQGDQRQYQVDAPARQVRGVERAIPCFRPAPVTILLTRKSWIQLNRRKRRMATTHSGHGNTHCHAHQERTNSRTVCLPMSKLF